MLLDIFIELTKIPNLNLSQIETNKQDIDRKQKKQQLKQRQLTGKMELKCGQEKS